MASLRTLSSSTTSTLRGALLPRFSPNHVQIRTVLTVTAFERAKQELYGQRWKETLTRKQKLYVEYKEQGREQKQQKLQKEHGDNWEAAAAEEAAKQYGSHSFQDKVQRLKEKLAAKEEANKAS
ncbi:hypothetical protein VPNG_08386 [Cytospora leucostoma]|uniref:Uncharacterized protein n=1 Tax=Cytospora leucostoma TaxID=1230097 RepID=A0A423W657_9PEZI|nr:hypothetical protein VPNG_08386 [Cytospora leucostoma]